MGHMDFQGMLVMETRLPFVRSGGCVMQSHSVSKVQAHSYRFRRLWWPDYPLALIWGMVLIWQGWGIHVPLILSIMVEGWRQKIVQHWQMLIRPMIKIIQSHKGFNAAYLHRGSLEPNRPFQRCENTLLYALCYGVINDRGIPCWHHQNNDTEWKQNWTSPSCHPQTGHLQLLIIASDPGDRLSLPYKEPTLGWGKF